jgi:hypothetical protein
MMTLKHPRCYYHNQALRLERINVDLIEMKSRYSSQLLKLMIMMLEFEDEKRATIANLRKRLKPIEHDILRGNRFYGKEAVHTENSEYFSSAQGNPQTSSVIRSLVSVGKPLSRKLSLAKIKLTKRQAVSPQTITNIKNSVEISQETDLHPFTAWASRENDYASLLPRLQHSN